MTAVTWFAAFVWTLALELPVYGHALRGRPGPAWLPLAVTGALNLTTHPALWLALPPAAPPALLFAAEAIVVATEGLLLGRLLNGPRALARGLAAALAANSLSAAAGLLGYALLAN